MYKIFCYLCCNDTIGIAGDKGGEKNWEEELHRFQNIYNVVLFRKKIRRKHVQMLYLFI